MTGVEAGKAWPPSLAARDDAQTNNLSNSTSRETLKANQQNNEKENHMNKQNQTVGNNMGTLAEDARALMAATADVAGEKVGEARKRLAAALESGREIYGRVRDKAVEGARAADQTVRENPYQAMAIAVGVGAIIGFLVARRCTRND